jgi:hypothetical protein
MEMETKIRMPKEATIEKIVSASMSRMADFATRATPGASYTDEDIAAAVMADPTSDTASFLAGVIAKSMEVVAVLDYADSVA